MENYSKKIIHIDPPFVIFDDGSGCMIKDLNFEPRIDTVVDKKGNRLTTSVDENCVGNACPIK